MLSIVKTPILVPLAPGKLKMVDANGLAPTAGTGAVFFHVMLMPSVMTLFLPPLAQGI
jgi:hypothetical protein